MTTKDDLRKELKYGVYKYIYNNEVIYIGKNDSSMRGSGIPQKVSGHMRDEKFRPYLKGIQIMYLSMADHIEDIAIAESGLIAQYCPLLNYASKSERKSTFDYDTFIQEQTGNTWKPFPESFLSQKSIFIPKHTSAESLKSEYNLLLKNYRKNEKALDCYIWVFTKLRDRDYKVVEQSIGDNPTKKYFKIEVDKQEYYEFLPVSAYARDHALCPGIYQTRSADGTYYYLISEDFPLFDSKKKDENSFLGLMGKTDDAYARVKG